MQSNKLNIRNILACFTYRTRTVVYWLGYLWCGSLVWMLDSLDGGVITYTIRQNGVKLLNGNVSVSQQQKMLWFLNKHFHVEKE